MYWEVWQWYPFPLRYQKLDLDKTLTGDTKAIAVSRQYYDRGRCWARLPPNAICDLLRDYQRQLISANVLFEWISSRNCASNIQLYFSAHLSYIIPCLVSSLPDGHTAEEIQYSFNGNDSTTFEDSLILPDFVLDTKHVQQNHHYWDFPIGKTRKHTFVGFCTYPNFVSGNQISSGLLLWVLPSSSSSSCSAVRISRPMPRMVLPDAGQTWFPREPDDIAIEYCRKCATESRSSFSLEVNS
jgi:hypothetical protein